MPASNPGVASTTATVESPVQKSVTSILKPATAGSEAMEISDCTPPPPGNNPSPPPPRSTATSATVNRTAAVPILPQPSPLPAESALPDAPALTPSESARVLLNDNFDAVTSPAAVTLARYIMNVLLSPQDERFRRINTQNKVFLTKVQPAKGTQEFLCSVGFRPTAADPTVLSLDRTTDGGSSGSSGPALSAAQLGRLEEGWEALQAALTELGVPAAERPAAPSLTAAELRAEREARAQAQQQVQQQVAFDPFRAHIVRAAPQVGSFVACRRVAANPPSASAAFTRGRRKY
jgi:hypothetical protein